MRVAANLSILFTEVPLLQRYARAAAAGFKLVEVSFPYGESAKHLRDAADRHGLQHVLINAAVGDLAAGFRGTAALASQKAEFPAQVEAAVEYARILNCKKIHVMAGIPLSEEDKAKADQTFLESISYAAERLRQDNIMCLIEPVNPISIPGYYLNNYDQALDILDTVKAPNLFIQFDFFHAEQIEGGIPKDIETWKGRIGHIQVAQAPDRGPPDSEGTIDYAHWFRWMKASGRDWIIGAEFTIEKDGEEAFEWIFHHHLSF